MSRLRSGPDGDSNRRENPVDQPTRSTPRAAGSDLNALLFEAFFGHRPDEPAPPFSTDLATAWILLQRLLEEHRWVEVVGTGDGGWICRIHDPGYSDPQWLGTVVGEGPTAPLAICRAAQRIAEGADARRRATA